MKRKRKSREAIQFRTGEALYGSNWKLPRPQERVPRSFQRPIMRGRKPRMTLVARMLIRPTAKRVLQLKLQRKLLVRPTLSSSKVQGRFVFRSPFFRQYQAMKFAGAVVRNPRRVGFCLKRKIRREVLFALRLSGFSGSGPGRRRTYRRNVDSLHGC